MIPLRAGGIYAGFEGGWWGRGRIWASIGVFAGITAAALLIIRPYYRRLRAAVGDPPVAADELIQLLNSRQPLGLAAIAFVGLGAIVWLMSLKPF